MAARYDHWNVPMQQIVGQFLQTFVEFPPRQKAASFTVARGWRSSLNTPPAATNHKRSEFMSRIVSVLAAVAMLAASGCAAIQRSDAMDAERMLAAANFQMKFARTPAQIEKANSLPQRKLTPVPGPDGKNRFVYADAEYCKCVYVGTEEAYDRYQKLSVKQQIAENEEAASMNWGAWGGWGPWY